MRYITLLLIFGLCLICCSDHDSEMLPSAHSYIEFNNDMVGTISDGNNYDLYLLDVWDQVFKQLLPSTLNEQMPEWKPDGTGISFVSEELYFLPLNSNMPEKLTEFGEDIYSYKWSPDGSAIALRLIMQDMSMSLYIIDADGSNPVMVEDRGTITDFYWLYEGTGLIYDLVDVDKKTLYKYTLLGSTEQIYASDSIVPVNFNVNQSPGSDIVFNTSSGIYRIRNDGTDLINVSQYDFPVPESVRFSPDGERLAFYKNSVGPFDVYTLDTNGTNERNVTSSEENDIFLKWSPDGSKLLLRRSGTYSVTDREKLIYIVNYDGSNALPVFNIRYSGQFSFHPDFQ